LKHKKATQFIKEYLALVKKYNMYVTNCGCCSSVGWVEDSDEETYKFIEKELNYYPPPVVKEKEFRDNKDMQCLTCLKGTYREVKNKDVVICDQCNANHPRMEEIIK